MSTLELRDLVKHYRGAAESIRAVDGVSLTVAPGELVGVYGPSGSGKTTLLELIAGLLTPEGGCVVFDGQVVSRLSAAEASTYRLRDVGLVFQSFHLIAGAPALDNTAIKLLADGFSLREARRQARPWLERVGLGSRMTHTPAQLSMGECQRIAIARALVNQPRLLLADEPTGSLDSARSSAILELLRDICLERAIPGLLVTHDPQAMPFLRSVYTLRDGRLAEGVDVNPASISPR